MGVILDTSVLVAVERGHLSEDAVNGHVDHEVGVHNGRLSIPHCYDERVHVRPTDC
jgi:hypothetical protein